MPPAIQVTDARMALKVSFRIASNPLLAYMAGSGPKITPAQFAGVTSVELSTIP